MKITNKDIKKWYTESEYVNLETGEQINKNEIENNYIIIRKKIKYEINNRGYNNTEQIGIRKIINECRTKPKQGTIF